MMTILDDIPAQKRLDPENIYNSIVALPQQCRHAWQECQKIALPDSYRRVNKILFSGMGGSGLGARIIESVYGDEIKYPLVRINDYDLPSWADKKTLVICSSFSGTTEETVSCSQQAQKKGLAWMAIGTGGSLIELAKKSRVPYYQIVPSYNPSKQPRMAIGYSVIGQLVMVSRTGLISFTRDDLGRLISTMKRVIKHNKREVVAAENPAKKLADTLRQKQVVFVAARHLTGAVHTFKNQMNENAKNLSHRHDIPELNHHLMEGLRFPDSNKKDVIFFFVNSHLYPARIRQRLAITQDVVKKNKIDAVIWQATAGTKLAENFELIQFGGFVNFYLATLYGINPSAIPWVDYFKQKLGQPLGQWK